jgi:hypothetical protein
MRYITKIKRFLRWVLRVFSVRPWDYGYIDNLIIWQLSDMQEAFSSNGAFSINSGNYAKEIKEFLEEFEAMHEEYSDKWPEISDPDFAKRMEYYEIKAFEERKRLYKLLGERMRYWAD